MTVALDVPSTRSSRRATGVAGVAGSVVRVVLRRGRFVLGLAGTAVLLAVVLPAVAGIPWSGIVATLGSVPWPVMGGLVLLWAGGLALHTIALTAALPGLGMRRAATLSLTGSAVANVLPVGGAAGVALNFKMARTWGFDARAMSRFTVVTNVWDVLAKVALPVVALPLLLTLGIGAQPLVATAVTAVVGAVVLAQRRRGLEGIEEDELPERAGRAPVGYPEGRAGAGEGDDEGPPPGTAEGFGDPTPQRDAEPVTEPA
jgi:hypothetical protein